MKKQILLSFLGLSASCFGQSLSNEVIGNSGDFYEGTSANLSWTLGEIMTETYSASGNILTQGFHQTYTGQNVGFTEIKGDFNVSLYPNPTADLATLIIHDQSESFQIKLFDLSGKLILSDTYAIGEIYEFDLSEYERGLYMVNIIGQTSGNATSLKLQKIN